MADLSADAASGWANFLAETIKELLLETDVQLWVVGSAGSHFPDLEIAILDDSEDTRQALHCAQTVFYFACNSGCPILSLAAEIPGVIIMPRECECRIAIQSLAVVALNSKIEPRSESICISCRKDPEELSKTLIDLAKSRSVLHSHLAVRHLALTASLELQRLFGDDATLLSPLIATAIYEILVPSHGV